MLRNNNLRIRYIASLLLVMVPILIFSMVLYTSTTERSIQYINDQSLQRFTSATENISNIVDRLQYTATTAFGVEDVYKRQIFVRLVVLLRTEHMYQRIVLGCNHPFGHRQALQVNVIAPIEAHIGCLLYTSRCV